MLLHLWKKCFMSYFHISSLHWPVNWWISRDGQLHVTGHISISNPWKWWISMDWPVKIVKIVVTFVKKMLHMWTKMLHISYIFTYVYYVYLCIYIMLHHIFPFQIPGLVGEMVNYLISRDWQLHLIFPYQIPGPVSEMVNFMNFNGLASENMCYICEKMLHMLHKFT